MTISSVRSSRRNCARFLAGIASLTVILAVSFASTIQAADQSGQESNPGVGFGSGIQVCAPPINPVTLSNPTTVTNCTQAGLQAALDAGGHINFSCGGGPVTIPLSSQLELSTSTSTVIDGGGLVTLDGQGITRIMHKGWHDPNSVGDITITLQNMRLINGKAPSGGGTGDHSGGAIASGYSGTRLHIIDSSFENNSTTDIHILDNQGGAIFSHNSHETIFSGVVFDGNRAGNGGAMGGISTGLLVFNSRFTDNHAQDDWSGGIVRGYGGAIHLDGVTNSGNPNSLKRVHVCGSEFEGNTSVRGGGALGVVVSDNKGTKATYEWSTFTNNEVFGLNGSYGQGGAIYHIEDDHAGANWEDNIEILNTTFHNNRAGRQGGGAWVYVLGHGLVENVTFEGNSTTAPFNTVGQGGAMVVTLGLIDINSTTFANNHAAYQAGALHAGGTGDPNKVVTLKNTIFLNNTLNEQLLPTTTEWQGYHTNRPMTDGGQNIQHPRLKPGWNNDVNNPITANPIYLDPLLLPLADNGGPTLTMALQFGSPAINNGAGGCPAIDQRGELRDPLCDIGPYEFLETSLMVAPAALAIEAGGVAQYEVSIQTSDPNPQPFDLTLTNSNPELQTSLQPSAIAAGETATLTVTDTHPTGPLIPGAWYSLPISADRPGEQLNGAVALLVGGYSVYLPLVDR